MGRAGPGIAGLSMGFSGNNSLSYGNKSYSLGGCRLITHVFREENGVADLMSLGFSNMDLVVWPSPPKDIQQEEFVVVSLLSLMQQKREKIDCVM